MRPLLLAALFFAFPARSDVSWQWNAFDYSLQAGFLAATTVDWLYTLEFTQHRDRYDNALEQNPFLGPTPGRARVNTLIPLAMLGHTAVAAALPHGIFRTLWQASWLGVELNAVRRNWVYGVQLRW